MGGFIIGEKILELLRDMELVLFITSVQRIYGYIRETNCISRVFSDAAVLYYNL
jgi:hypothetical protein